MMIHIHPKFSMGREWRAALASKKGGETVGIDF
jgi:hypothetical protein